MADREVVIIIPVYKSEPNGSETLSLKQCLRILHKYPVIFIAPEDLDTKCYEAICSEFDVSFASRNFERHFFRSIAGYNQLMLSPEFYKSFMGFRYMLVYQLDAYVFKDELSEWCGKNYDFIGAPHLPHTNGRGEIQFLKGYVKVLHAANWLLGTKRELCNVGNGGLSLRKVRKCYWLVKLLRKKVGGWGSNNEDGFFKYWGNICYPFFRLPADAVALRFSVEQFPGESLIKLGGELPFGCHAFEKYEWDTWKPYIIGQGC